ncbi:hypothetical protein SODALDRAFT_342098 [Sodiomyces alkalinus F11]|uniref:Uncharacterized protein n=1 Tax=Sodiomyces alkalinus (strain CBS 110278 / VKM F-3762 / F11) TaxID=1314773 RepID=A0A3N2Q7S4_SODAK|nr:hypothetical protein SODALDRAFT_342098 [Sodiomyces alkalinus F11]ROT42829.1 hypothetical protein SODALDRAFT_342098 [Sodiomyces alkalinus F11]
MSTILEAWYKWKALRLPWRKRFLVGRDLNGNTFWEFRESRGAGPGRFRRIVKYPRSTHYSEVKVSPIWHQWLRHVREQPPSLQEQAQDIKRQEKMKILAAQANARWEAKPRVMDAPGQEYGQPVPALDTMKTQPIAPEAHTVNKNKSDSATQEQLNSDPELRKKKYGYDPWDKAKGPGEGWQPQAWTPPASKRK